jgi:dihydroorotase
VRPRRGHDPDVDVFDREAVFIERVLEPLTRALPELKIVFEHITTAEAAQFVSIRARRSPRP